MHKNEPRKRIYNPKTGKYYQLRLYSSPEGRKGTIQGLWKNPKKPFHFYKDIDQPLGISADNLHDFGEKIKSIDITSLEFHMKRGDFEFWINYLGNTVLQKRLMGISARALKGEDLREKLCKIIVK